MILLDFRAQFNSTIPICEGFFDLMKKTFGFYAILCNEFLSNLGAGIENHTLDQFLQDKIRPQLFNVGHCKNIETIKRQFLAENIKLEQFINENNYKQDFLNDLNSLKKVSDAVYELLQKHWELYKYEKSNVNNQVLVSFILEIDRVGIAWDAYLEKYLAVSRILTTKSQEVQKPGYNSVEVSYHLPETTDLNLKAGSRFIEFLQLAFEVILKIHNQSDADVNIEILSLDATKPINCVLRVPEHLAESYKRFLNYLSVDVLKRETLVKFVLEVLRLQQAAEISKTALTPIQKKLAKQLNQLHPEGYFSVSQDKDEDSVNILSSLCQEMEQLEINFKELLSGSNQRLVRNRLQPAISSSQQPPQVGQKSAKVASKPVGKAISGGKNEEKGKEESTLKIDVKNKEHINFLTSYRD